MKKTITWILLAAMLLTCAIPAMAEDAQSALDAFNSLTGKNVTAPADALDAAVSGQYDGTLADLTDLTEADLAAYAAEKGLPLPQVRNAWYIAMAGALSDALQADPTDAQKDAQKVLALFLKGDADKADRSVRDAIRKEMTGLTAQLLADAYGLPVDFVKFLVMDDDWDNDDWNDDWADTPDDSPDDYLDTPDGKDNSPDDTPDDTPDGSPDDSPDATPDNSPDDTPDDTPDYTNSPDDTPDDSPAATRHPSNNNNNRKNNSPDNSPDNSGDDSPDNS